MILKIAVAAQVVFIGLSALAIKVDRPLDAIYLILASILLQLARTERKPPEGE